MERSPSYSLCPPILNRVTDITAKEERKGVVGQMMKKAGQKWITCEMESLSVPKACKIYELMESTFTFERSQVP